MANPVTHFEIHAGNPERAMKFYGDIFGWTFKSWEGGPEYWLVSTKNGDFGIDGGLLRRMGPNPEPTAPVMGAVITIQLDGDIDEYSKKVLAAGAIEALPKQDMGMGWVAYYKDTEGNVFGMFQEKPEKE